MTGLFNLVRYVTIYRFAQAKLRTLLSVGGIVLGVATLVGVLSMNDSILGAFQKGVDEVSGKTEIEVAGGSSGFPEDVYLAIQGIEGVAHHTPILEATAIYTAADGRRERLLVMGIDTLADKAFRTYELTEGSVDMTDPIEFLNATDSIILTEPFAAAQGIALGDAIDLVTSAGRKAFVVRGLLEPTGPAKTFGGAMALMDVYAAQIAFQRERTVDRVDIITDGPERVAQVMAAVKAVVPAGLDVRRPYQRSGYVDKLLRSFRSGLYMGSLVALLTGTFLIYNTISISVVQRRKEIGIMRSLGVSRHRIRLLFTMEALLMGAVGSALGIPAGLLLARGLLGTMSRTVSDIYLKVDVREVVLRPNVVALGAVLGVLATLLAALYPAVVASRITVLETLRVTSFDVSSQSRVGRSAAVGVFLLAVAGVLAALPAWSNFPLGGYLSALAVLLGISFLTPAFMLLWRHACRPVARSLGGVLGTLATDNMVKALGRSSITVAALMIGLSMMVSVSAFLHSIRASMGEWIDQSINADLVVTASSRVVGPSATPMAPQLGATLAAYPGVVDVTHFRMMNIPFRDSLVLLVTIDMPKYLRHNELIVFEGDVERGLPRLLSSEGVYVSDNFANLYGVKAGDRITLQTPTGPHDVSVEAVIRDYSSDNGVVMADRELLARFWRDDRVDSYGVYLAAGVDGPALRQRIADEHGADYNLFVLTNEEFRGDIFGLLDNSFRIADALQMLALVISLLGIVNTLLAQVLDRTRVLGVLRAIGTERRQLRRLVMMEAGFLGMAGNVVGIAAGSILAALLVYVINAQSTGWVVDLHFPLKAVTSVFVTALLVAVIAGYYPASRAASLDIVRALEYE